MIITKTPFRISFAGGGSDIKSFYKYYNGKVVSTTIDKYIYVVVRKQLGIYEFKYRVNWSKTEFTNSIDKIKHPIVREALRYFKIDYPMEITTFSDIPANTGLASSSAFAVGLVHALLALKRKKISKHLIASVAAKIEVDFLKRNIGKQDHFACAYGGINQITFFKNEKVKVKKIKSKKIILNNLRDNLQLYYTTIKRNASKTLKTQIKLDDLQKKNIIKLTNFTDPISKIFSSNKGSLNSFGLILHQSWLIKKAINIGTTTKEIDGYYEKALKNGAIGGKILGAGNGGFFLFFIKAKYRAKLEKSLKNLKKLDFEFDNKGSVITYNDKK